MEGATAELRIRVAVADDVNVIRQVVQDAYRHYIVRIGRPPAPMLDDYAAQVSAGTVWVLDHRDAVVGVIVLIAEADHLLIHNVAVDPLRRGTGLGRCLLSFAEAEAARRGYAEIRLFTHRKMVENQRLYAAIGYEETDSRTEFGYDRVFMRKRLVPRLSVEG